MSETIRHTPLRAFLFALSAGLVGAGLTILWGVGALLIYLGACGLLLTVADYKRAEKLEAGRKPYRREPKQ